MKKCIILFAFLFAVFFAQAQEIQQVATVSTKMGYWPIGTVVFVQSTGNFYKLEIPSSDYSTMTSILASAGRYTYLGTLSTASPTLTSLIIRNDTIHNKDANGLDFNNSITVADTIFGEAGSWTGKSTYTSATPMVFNNRTLTKGIDFGTSRITGSSTFANNAFAYGTNAVPVYVTAVAGHIIPISVSQHVSASGAYDVAAMRLRTDSDADTTCDATFINVIEGRSALYGTIAGHAGFNMSTSMSGNTTITGDGVAILAKIEGSGNVTSSNHITPFMSTVTATGTGIDDCGYFSPNGATVTDVVKLETVNSATVTNMLNIANTSGTTTNGLVISGTYSGNSLETSGATSLNGAWKSTAYQQIDSTSGVVTAGKQVVGYWSKATGGTDTLSLVNMAVGERITVIKLGSAGAGGGVNLVVKSPALLVNLTAVFWPNAGSTTGATSVSLTNTAPTKTFYKMDATHIWVY